MSAVAPPLPDNLGDRLDDATAEELRNMETVMDQSEALVDELPGCECVLERRWILWHGFMTQHAHLDAWLRLAEQVVASQCVPVIYTSAREDLSRFERLRCEAASQLVQLDGLTQRNRTLTRLFHGAMRARLLRMVRECGERWDSVNAKLESVAARLKLFVSEWEEFEAEREELDLWLTDLDTRLTEVNHLTGNTCDKLRLLQSFQQGVCMNLGRVNELLRRGETLIQRSKVADMHHVESDLVELLRRCSHVHNNIAQTHTRLLSMRLVFEDDWILSHATDSGCPSESLLEDEGALDKLHLPTSSVLHE
ncbi:nesprin-2-like, partial [Lampetra planeri]